MILHGALFASGSSLDLSSFHVAAFTSFSTGVHAGSYGTPLEVDIDVSLVGFTGDWLGVRLWVDQSSVTRGPNGIAISGIML